MKKFISKLFSFSLIGLIYLTIMGILYITFDPFKVLHDYDSFYVTGSKGRVHPNADYVSTTTFIKNKRDYNSFIFGNSRSIFYEVSDWKQYLNDNDDCYHFDASGESIWAINKKIEFVDKNVNDIKNILLVIDYDVLYKDKPGSGHIGIISPALVNNSNIIDFHTTFLYTFLNPRFTYAYIDYKVSNQIKPYMKKGYLIDDRQIVYDNLTNELRFDYYENLIKKNKYYTPERLSIFYNRDTTTQRYSTKCIYDSQKKILENISSITKMHNTNVKVIVNPLYDQLKINVEDLKYLKTLFGDANVFDFSGINKFTNDYKNYYEASHYRPHVAKEIMEKIYYCK